MSLRKRGEYWQMRVYDPASGRYVEKSTKQTKKTLAAQVEARFVRELARDRERAILGLKGGETIKAVLERYGDEVSPRKAPGTQRREKAILRDIVTFFVGRGDPDIAQVKARDVEAMMTWKGSGGVKPRTVNLYRAVLRHALQHAMQVWDLLDANPVDKVRPLKESPRQPHIVTEDELERLLAATLPSHDVPPPADGHCRHCGARLVRKRRPSGLEPMAQFRERLYCDRACMAKAFSAWAEPDPTLHLFVLTMTETGARSQSEILTLRWEDVDFETGFIFIRSDDTQRTKTGQSRWVPMSPRLDRALRRHAADYRLSVGSQWVFCHLVPRKGAVRGQRIASLYRGFKAACKRAGLPATLRPHDLRHAFVTRKLAAGHSPVLVREIVGHADLRTTMKYTHLVRDDLRSVVASPVAKPKAAG